MKVNERKLRLEVLEGRDTPSTGLSDLAVPVAAPPADQMMMRDSHLLAVLQADAMRLYEMSRAYTAQLEHTKFGEGMDVTAAPVYQEFLVAAKKLYVGMRDAGMRTYDLMVNEGGVQKTVMINTAEHMISGQGGSTTAISVSFGDIKLDWTMR